MNKYHFTSLDLNKKIVKGIIYAEDLDELRSTLDSQKLYLLKYKKQSNSYNYITKFSRVKTVDIINMSKEFGIMLKTGLSLGKTLETLIISTKNKRLSKILNNIYLDILNGKSLSDAFSKYPNVFSKFYINMINVGEKAGNLDDTFLKTAKWLENEAKMKKSALLASSYPIFIIFLIIIVIGILSVFVMPMFSDLFNDFGGELPTITKIVINITTFIKDNILYLTFGLCFLVFLFLSLKKFKTCKFIFDYIKLSNPIFKKFLTSLTLYRLTSGILLLTSSGIDLSKSISEMSGLLNNTYVESKLKKASLKIKQGESISRCLKETKLFDNMFIEMLNVLTQTGEVKFIINELNKYYEEEVKSTLKSLTSMLEPLLIMVVAGIVGIVIISVFLPMIGLMDIISNS